MSAYPAARPPPASQAAGPSAVAGPSNAMSSSSQQQQQQHQQQQHREMVKASSRNPQLGPRPYFRYPTPTPAEIEEDLPPYMEAENIPLGLLLDRLTRKSYVDLRTLVDTTLPSLAAHKKPKHVIEYAKTARQAALKYLAVLRWKTSVDLSSCSPPSGSSAPTGAQASFPTPHSNGESSYTSPAAQPWVVKGKVTDARRVQQFLEHQNAQHERSIDHLQHVTRGIKTLCERNADLVTALTLRAAGTYTRLPWRLTENFLPQPPLQASGMLESLERLNEQLLYRLRSVDFLPPELVVERVADGRAHVRGGGQYGWVADLTVVGFEDDSPWHITGFDWAWSAEGSSKTINSEERQRVLDAINMVMAPPEEQPEETAGDRVVDAPLVRMYNYMQHISLACQLQVMAYQAAIMGQGRWRGQLDFEMSDSGRSLILKYWVRPRPTPQQKEAPRRNASTSSPASRAPPLYGGIVTISLEESRQALNEAEKVLRDIAACGQQASERTVRLQLAVKWEVGEACAGGGMKAGDSMDASILKIDPASLSVRDILTTATRTHAGHLARGLTIPLLKDPKFILDPLDPPRLQESDTDGRPFSLIVPLPMKNGSAQFVISVAPMTGLIDIEDSAVRDAGQFTENNRTMRAHMKTVYVNRQKTNLADDLWHLISAAIMEDVEDNLRHLGLHPTRRVALQSADVISANLHNNSTAFVPLPVSPLHYFMCQITSEGISYELLRLRREPVDDNRGRMKMAIGDRIPIELGKLAERRAARGTKRALEDDDSASNGGDLPVTIWEEGGVLPKGRRFLVDPKDLHDMFIYCNALVAQTMVEQQLKDRGIPYITQYPDESDFVAPRSRSALAGLVPNICVNASDLFKDGRTHEVAAPQVYLVIMNWWKGAQCSVETIVRLRHQPSVTDTPQTVAPASSSAARAEGITFDHNTQTVRFHAPNIARCVPDFLEQWERLNKVFVVAGEVNRLNKMEQYRDIRMLSFDLCTATLQYAHGFQVAITYTPATDSYEASFFRTGAATSVIPGETPAVDSEPSPHQQLAPLLSHYLNEVTAQSSAAKEAHGGAGQQFIALLRATLPFLLEVESMRTSNASDYPALVVRSITEYRLVWDHETTRYALDVTLTCNGTRFLLSDPSQRKEDAPAAWQLPKDLTCGPLTALPKLESAVSKGFQAARAARVATPGSGFSAATPMYATPMTQATPGPGAGAQQATPAGVNGVVEKSSKAASGGVKSIAPPLSPAVKLDAGTALLVSTDVVADVIRAMSAEIESAIVGGVVVKATPK